MKKSFITLYGLLAYGTFLFAFLYMIGFLANSVVPTTIDNGTSHSLAQAILINLSLITLFGMAHSIMARSWFKVWWTRIIPEAAERSTYVLQAALLLLLIVWQWQALPTSLWSIENEMGRLVIWGIFWLGHVITLVSTFLINHFELTGLQQIWYYLREQEPPPMTMKQPFFYRIVRHPMQLGLIIGFWATPDMTVGHLLFAAVMTGYIMIGLHFEEKALVRQFGDDYRHYQNTTPKLFPRFRLRRPVSCLSLGG
ncbi:methanethiol S-methyltransferase [Candidatus Leptofilum sp.]|uniref:methanethiol S-methyltransferase n=1 Tax=Candidatus Leptofilum sp. TaxID=3241576 RepID=UPI003B59D400